MLGFPIEIGDSEFVWARAMAQVIIRAIMGPELRLNQLLFGGSEEDFCAIDASNARISHRKVVICTENQWF